MAAEINAKNFFFEGQDDLFRIFLNLRHTDLKFLFIFLRSNIKKAQLSGHGVLFVLVDTVDDLRIYGHLLFPVSFQTVQCSGLDQIFHNTFVDLINISLHKSFQGSIFPVLLSFPHNPLNNRAADTLDSRKCIADGTVVNRKTIHAMIDIRRKDLDSHLTAYGNILRYLVWHFHNGRHQRSHEFYRIVIFQICSLVGNHRISGSVRLIESILRKVCHLIVDLVCDLLGNAVGDTARNPLFHISVNEILALFCHNRSFLLGHGTAHQVASSKSIACKITDDLHNLLLVYDTAIGRLQDGLHLRAVITDGIRTVFSADVLRNEIHGTRTVKGNSRDDILKALRLQFLHEVFHSGTLELEHAVSTSCSERIQYFFVVVINFLHIQENAGTLFYHFYRVLDNGQGT